MSYFLRKKHYNSRLQRYNFFMFFNELSKKKYTFALGFLKRKKICTNEKIKN